METSTIFLILYLLIPAREGTYIPQYIPMPTIEECERIKPLIVSDVLKNKSFSVKQQTPFMIQLWGQSELQRQTKEINVDVNIKSAYAECRKIGE